MHVYLFFLLSFFFLLILGVEHRASYKPDKCSTVSNVPDSMTLKLTPFNLNAHLNIEKLNMYILN